MADRIKPNKVNIQSVTKDGECNINICLELNINVNSSGVEVTAKSIAPLAKQEEEKKESVYMIPDFGSNEIIDFGK
jgi:hypothetical protein